MVERVGKFIVFEGLDGCGKSTQLEYLRERLYTLCRSAGTRKVFATCEPSDSVPGLVCRGVIKKTLTVHHETEALLFAADRYEHITNVVLPQLRDGNHVLCDRFFLSNFAYQSAETDMNTILQYNLASVNLLVPDVTIFIDVSPEECERRRLAARVTEDKHEKLERAKIIREGYFKAMELLKGYQKELLIIDGAKDANQTFEALWNELTARNIFPETELV